MRPDLLEKQEVIYKLAKEYDVIFIDLSRIFDEMVAGGTAMEEISADGVHPTDFGHAVIAEEWLKAVL